MALSPHSIDYYLFELWNQRLKSSYSPRLFELPQSLIWVPISLLVPFVLHLALGPPRKINCKFGPENISGT